MTTDARIAVGLPTHPKTKKLIKRLGQAAAWNLVCLFLWAAANRRDGDLSGMTDEDIELAADWLGEEGAFVSVLLEVRFLDADGAGGYLLHDWQDHNPWAAGADMRSAKARWNAVKKHHGAAEADRQIPEYAAVRNGMPDMSLTEIRDTYERLHSRRIDLNRVSARVSDLVAAGRLQRREDTRPCSVTTKNIHPVFVPAHQARLFA